jgi:predicted PurR-regulated permease PerM
MAVNILQKKKLVFYITLTLVTALFMAILYVYRSKIGKIATPFFLAILIAYIVKPLVIRMEKRKIPRMAGILMIYLLSIIILVAACIFFFPELINNTKELLTTLPHITSSYQQTVSGFLSAIKTSNWSDEIKNMILREVQNVISIIQEYTGETLKRALDMVIDTVTLLIDLVISMVIAYYFIKDTEEFKASVLLLIPRRWRNGIIGLGREINLILSNFIQGQLLTAFIIGIMESLGLMLVKVKYPLVLGMVGGIANIIPYFGPFIGAIPAVAVALIESPLRALWAVLVFAVVQQIDNSFISPKVIEGRLGLHPVATIFAVLIGGEFFGIPGMLLSVPVMAILRVIIKKVVDAIASS